MPERSPEAMDPGLASAEVARAIARSRECNADLPEHRQTELEQTLTADVARAFEEGFACGTEDVQGGDSLRDRFLLLRHREHACAVRIVKDGESAVHGPLRLFYQGAIVQAVRAGMLAGMNSADYADTGALGRPFGRDRIGEDIRDSGGFIPLLHVRVGKLKIARVLAEVDPRSVGQYLDEAFGYGVDEGRRRGEGASVEDAPERRENAVRRVLGQVKAAVTRGAEGNAVLLRERLALLAKITPFLRTAFEHGILAGVLAEAADRQRSRVSADEASATLETRSGVARQGVQAVVLPRSVPETEGDDLLEEPATAQAADVQLPLSTDGEEPTPVYDVTEENLLTPEEERALLDVTVPSLLDEPEPSNPSDKDFLKISALEDMADLSEPLQADSSDNDFVIEIPEEEPAAQEPTGQQGPPVSKETQLRFDEEWQRALEMQAEDQGQQVPQLDEDAERAMLEALARESPAAPTELPRKTTQDEDEPEAGNS